MTVGLAGRSPAAGSRPAAADNRPVRSSSDLVGPEDLQLPTLRWSAWLLGDGRGVLVELERLNQRRLGAGADSACDHLAVLHQHDGRDAERVELRGQTRLGVDVDLADLDAARVVVGDLVDDRGNQAARTAPCRPTGRSVQVRSNRRPRPGNWLR